MLIDTEQFITKEVSENIFMKLSVKKKKKISLTTRLKKNNNNNCMSFCKTVKCQEHKMYIYI